MADRSLLTPREVWRAATLSAGMHVADFGSGSGFFTRAAARAVGEEGHVFAVDVHRDMLPRIKALATAEGLHNVEVMHGDVEQAGGSHLKDEEFDFVIVTNLLFCSENKKAVVEEARRILRRNGRALVIDWSGSYGGLGPHPDHVVAKEEALKLFEEGFVYERDIPGGAYHWGFIARKKS